MSESFFELFPVSRYLSRLRHVRPPTSLAYRYNYLVGGINTDPEWRIRSNIVNPPTHPPRIIPISSEFHWASNNIYWTRAYSREERFSLLLSEDRAKNWTGEAIWKMVRNAKGTKGKVRTRARTTHITDHRINHPSGRPVAFEQSYYIRCWMDAASAGPATAMFSLACLYLCLSYVPLSISLALSSCSFFFPSFLLSFSPSINLSFFLCFALSFSFTLFRDSDRPTVDSLSTFHTILRQWLAEEKRILLRYQFKSCYCVCRIVTLAYCFAWRLIN